MTLEQYTEEVKRLFPVGAKSKEEVEAFFREEETLETIKESYEEYIDPECQKYGLGDPAATASCLDYMY